MPIKYKKQNFSSMTLLYTILAEKLGERTPLEKSRQRLEDVKNLSLKNMGDYGLDSTGSEKGARGFLF
jgi:hypothetical protein